MKLIPVLILLFTGVTCLAQIAPSDHAGQLKHAWTRFNEGVLHLQQCWMEGYDFFPPAAVAQITTAHQVAEAARRDLGTFIAVLEARSQPAAAGYLRTYLIEFEPFFDFYRDWLQQRSAGRAGALFFGPSRVSLDGGWVRVERREPPGWAGPNRPSRPSPIVPTSRISSVELGRGFELEFWERGLMQVQYSEWLLGPSGRRIEVSTASLAWRTRLELIEAGLPGNPDGEATWNTAASALRGLIESFVAVEGPALGAAVQTMPVELAEFLANQLPPRAELAQVIERERTERRKLFEALPRPALARPTGFPEFESALLRAQLAERAKAGGAPSAELLSAILESGQLKLTFESEAGPDSLILLPGSTIDVEREVLNIDQRKIRLDEIREITPVAPRLRELPTRRGPRP